MRTRARGPETPPSDSILLKKEDFKNFYKEYKMSSMLRSFAEAPKLPVKFMPLETPSYYSNILGYTTLFPFTYSNGKLDIAYIDDFEAEMVTSTGNSPSSSPNESIQLAGGVGLVQSLGPNFQAYIRAWRTTDSGTPINIYSNGIVQKVQIIDVNHVDQDSVARVSTTPPSSDNYTVGVPVNNYRSTWIFKTPLTITTVESGVTQYITFTSRLDED